MKPGKPYYHLTIKNMDIEGSIKVIMDPQTFSSGFQKREFVITTKEKYPQDIKFELIKDSIDLVAPYKTGDLIKVHFNLRGNEYNGKYFVNVQAWRLEPLSSASGAPSSSSNGSSNADPFSEAGFPDEPTIDSSEPDDLPF
ncbi:DUF3127 domain-containing protein [Salibacteraceae bacterium]|jgi:single-strand DNA-binding protein|nr:DUF3127 domain-containing protein [Salibacteraceae bacterium]